MNLFKYILCPKIVQYRKPKLRNLGFLYLLYFIIVALLIPAISIISSYFGIVHISPKGFDKSTLLVGVFLAPIYEEILCRLGLVLSKKNYYFLLICLFTLVIVELVRVRYLLSGIFLFLFIILFCINFTNKSNLKFLFIKYFRFIFWFSALLFGLLHATNFQGNTLVILLFSPLLCFPQIIMGLILGYIRMNYGFIYGVLIHFVINSIMLLNLIHK